MFMSIYLYKERDRKERKKLSPCFRLIMFGFRFEIRKRMSFFFFFMLQKNFLLFFCYKEHIKHKMREKFYL
jgi:hypothetical protein